MEAAGRPAPGCHTEAPGWRHTLSFAFQEAFQTFPGTSHSNPTFPLISSTATAEGPFLSGQAVGNGLKRETWRGTQVRRGAAGRGEEIRNGVLGVRWVTQPNCAVSPWPRAWTESWRRTGEGMKAAMEVRKLAGKAAGAVGAAEGLRK